MLLIVSMEIGLEQTSSTHSLEATDFLRHSVTLSAKTFKMRQSLVTLSLGGAPSLGTLEDMLRKALDMGISLHRGPFPAAGNLECGEKGGLINRGLWYEWRRALVGGHLGARDSMKGTLREGSVTGDPERYIKWGSEMGICFHRGPAFGEHGGALFP
jgi:hypothetical protein